MTTTRKTGISKYKSYFEINFCVNNFCYVFVAMIRACLQFMVIKKINF